MCDPAMTRLITLDLSATSMQNKMSVADQQAPKKTGGGDGRIAPRLRTLDIKDYCDQAVAHLKAGRLEEAYLYANEALELDGEDVKAAALRRYALYALHPTMRLVDKVKALREEARQCLEARDRDKGLELISLAKKWHCTASILCFRGAVNFGRKCFDLAYLDATETLARLRIGDDDLVGVQNYCLQSLGFKVLPVIEPHQRRVDEPTGICVAKLFVCLEEGLAYAMDASYSTQLVPPIPLSQLARFLNNDVQSGMKSLVFQGRRESREEEAVLRMLDEVAVPGRLHADLLGFDDFFHLPWADIKRILDGRTLRCYTASFLRLQLPSGVNADEFLKLSTIRECTGLAVQLYDVHRPRLPGPQPLFSSAALVEWLKSGVAGRPRMLQITREYLSSGLLSFLDALKKDFQQATRPHSYRVLIFCPDFDVANGLRVQDEQLSNRHGERMKISVGEIPAVAVMTGYRFETVQVERSPRT